MKSVFPQKFHPSLSAEAIFSHAKNAASIAGVVAIIGVGSAVAGPFTFATTPSDMRGRLYASANACRLVADRFVATGHQASQRLRSYITRKSLSE